MKVCWFSTGISSFVACYLAKDVDEIIYTHVPNQHPDEGFEEISEEEYREREKMDEERRKLTEE